jgi:hypothetical protein
LGFIALDLDPGATDEPDPGIVFPSRVPSEEPMAEDKSKKPKIDLKARLGKTSQGAAPAGIAPIAPTPSATGSQPPPAASADGTPVPQVVPPPSLKPTGIAPPPGIAPAGISLPPFARPAQPQPKAKPVSAEQQTIKVEVSEEVEAQRKKARRNVVIAGVIASVVGLAIGFLAGGRSESTGRASRAVKGAGALEADVKTATQKLKEFGAVLDQGLDDLDHKKYPGDLLTALSSTQIPFDETKFEGKYVGDLPPKTMRLLFSYTRGVADVNDKKDSLKNLLGILKPDVEKAWAEEKKPVFNLSVIFKGGGDKTTVELVRNKEPFEIDKWPADYTVIGKEVREGRRVDADKKVTRWVKGDLTGSSPIAMPVDPASSNDFTNERVVLQLKKGILDIKTMLEGDKSNPQAETSGLLKDGDVLNAQLNEISLKK